MTNLGNSPFRERAIVRAAEPEPLDDLAQLTAPREWAVLASLGLALALLVAWGVLGSVERTLRADGLLALSGERRAVLAEVPGTIAAIDSPVGARVAAGQTIARLVPAGIEPSLRLAATAAGLLERDAESGSGAERAEARRLLDRAQALYDGLTALREEGAIASPVDGAIANVFVAPGQTIQVGAPVAAVVTGDAGRLEAIAFLAPQDALRIEAGMTARVIVETPEGLRSLPAELGAVATRAAPPPDWLTRMRPEIAASGRGHTVRLVLQAPRDGDEIPGGLEDGTPCQIEIVLERASPFALAIRR